MNGVPVELVDLLPWSTVGPIGLLALAVLLVLTGRLIPSRVAKDANDALERENLRLQEEAKEWRTAFQTVTEAQVLSAHQIEELLEYARTTNDLLQALGEMDDSDTI